VAGSWLPRQSSDDLLLDTIMLRLRLGDGLDLRQLAASHVEGEEAAERVRAALQPHVERGWVVAGGGGGSGEVQQVLRLADPQGFVVSNDIISDVFAAFDITEED
jgi:oxygen-independent coproporphyrinogen-3 oxidase